MPDGSAIAYLYDGTFEGLMTAVFEAFAHRPMPAAIEEIHGYQPQFGQRSVEIAAEAVKAGRVVEGIRRIMGPEDYEQIWLAFLSEQRERGNWIYAYIRLGMEKGRRIHSMLTDERVAVVRKWSGLVSLESHHLLQFVRFSKREGGVYYSRIQPEYDVTALLMPHFAQRFHIQPFIIHDKTRNRFGVFDTREWYLTDAAEITLPAGAREEQDYQQLWKTFYHTVAIKERTNPRCQMQFMPKKYWKEITEMRDIPNREHTVFAPETDAARDELPGEPIRHLPSDG